MCVMSRFVFVMCNVFNACFGKDALAIFGCLIFLEPRVTVDCRVYLCGGAHDWDFDEWKEGRKAFRVIVLFLCYHLWRRRRAERSGVMSDEQDTVGRKRMDFMSGGGTDEDGRLLSSCRIGVTVKRGWRKNCEVK